MLAVAMVLISLVQWYISVPLYTVLPVPYTLLFQLSTSKSPASTCSVLRSQHQQPLKKFGREERGSISLQ